VSARSNGAQTRRFGPLQLVLSLGGLAAAIASIYGLYQIINPPPPASAGGELSDITLDTGTGFVYVNFEAAIEGYSGKQCEVRWTLFDADSRAIYPDSEFQNQHATYIIPSRNQDEGTQQFKVPSPGPGHYYVRLTLLPPGDSGEDLPLDEANSEVFLGRINEQGNEVTGQQKEDTTQSANSPEGSSGESTIQNLNTPPSQAPEGVVPVSPDFNASAASAVETAVINAAIGYYEYAETGQYYATYDLLSSEDKTYYTQDEWVAANTALDSAAGEFVVTDAYPDDLGLGVPTYAVAVTVYADGSSFNRTTYFIYENGYWAHYLSTEEVNLFDDALY
jgi:hypothetical protein